MPLPRSDQNLRRAVLGTASQSAAGPDDNHEKTLDPRSRSDWQACFHSRGLQRAARKRPRLGRHAHPRDVTHSAPSHRARRAPGARFASRQAKGQGRSEIQPGTRRGKAQRDAGQARGIRVGLRRRRYRSQKQGPTQRRSAAPRKRALSPAGRSERSRIFEATRGAVRSTFRLRRVRLRASRARLGRGHHEIRAPGRSRAR